MPVNYDEAAAIYDRRFTIAGREQVARALLTLVHDLRPRSVLEVGCGTGHWLMRLCREVPHVWGIDLSWGMLQRARERNGRFGLIRGHANALPFSSHSFDLVYCVSALHHFDDPASFIRDVHHLLRDRGILTIIGMNPHAGGRDHWYIYDYFPGVRQRDLERYPSSEQITDWMVASGFEPVEWQVAARIMDTRMGRAVLEDPMLQKNATSQLAALSDAAYAAGISQIEAALVNAARDGRAVNFPVDISLTMVTGRVSGARVMIS